MIHPITNPVAINLSTSARTSQDRNPGLAACIPLPVRVGATLHFEIFKEAGERRAIEKVFRGLIPNDQGRMEVGFEPLVQYAAVNALELTAEK